MSLRESFEELRRTPPPRLYGLGNMGLWESLLAGRATSVLAGGPAGFVPEPDEGTLEVVRSLEGREDPSDEELEYLRYYRLLDDVRRALADVRGDEDRS